MPDGIHKKAYKFGRLFFCLFEAERDALLTMKTLTLNDIEAYRVVVPYLIIFVLSGTVFSLGGGNNQ